MGVIDELRGATDLVGAVERTGLWPTIFFFRSAWVNVMPEWLLSVISGILAGGIPGFRIELCCFFHPLAWPLCVV